MISKELKTLALGFKFHSLDVCPHPFAGDLAMGTTNDIYRLSSSPVSTLNSGQPSKLSARYPWSSDAQDSSGKRMILADDRAALSLKSRVSAQSRTTVGRWPLNLIQSRIDAAVALYRSSIILRHRETDSPSKKPTTLTYSLTQLLDHWLSSSWSPSTTWCACPWPTISAICPSRPRWADGSVWDSRIGSNWCLSAWPWADSPI